MAENEYVFIDRWRVEGDVQEIADILDAAGGLVRWWRSVYLDCRELEPGGARGIGKVVQFRAKGFLPYTLTINFRTVESNYPYGFKMEATGDLEGVGVWTFQQDGTFVDITYDWRVKANKGILSALSFLLKPIFAANHRWTMARGEESLKLELLRRHATSPQTLLQIPAPRGPVFPHNLKLFR
jgi:hypothetical protein